MRAKKEKGGGRKGQGQRVLVTVNGGQWAEDGVRSKEEGERWTAPLFSDFLLWRFWCFLPAKQWLDDRRLVSKLFSRAWACLPASRAFHETWFATSVSLAPLPSHSSPQPRTAH